MSNFTPVEIAYLQSQQMGRMATVGPQSQPHVVPVLFRYNPALDTIDIGGYAFVTTKKYRDAQRNPRVALVVDNVASVSPRRGGGIEIRGTAQIVESGGEQIGPGFDPEILRIRPTRIVSWGLEDGPMVRNARSIP